MRIGHFQVAVKTDAFQANLAKFVEGLQRADRDRVEIVCFPECFLTGCRIG
jgi:predicted amidohydrolase